MLFIHFNNRREVFIFDFLPMHAFPIVIAYFCSLALLKTRIFTKIAAIN